MVNVTGTWTCPKCSHLSGYSFACSRCGNRIGVNCPNCGTLTELITQFCPKCGCKKENVYREQVRDQKDQIHSAITRARTDFASAERKMAFPTVLFATLFNKLSSFAGFTIDIFVGFVLVGIIWWFLGDRYPLILIVGVAILGLGINYFRRVVNFTGKQQKIMSDSAQTITRYEKALDELTKVDLLTWCDILEAKRIQERSAANDRTDENQEQKWTMDEERAYFEEHNKPSFLFSLIFGGDEDKEKEVDS